MAANTYLQGRVINVNTTGTVASNRVVVTGWIQTRYSTGAGTISTGAIIVEKASGVRVIGAKGASGQTIVMPLPMGTPFNGLSCTGLVTGTTVRIYLG